jgi:hypothetical protein
MHYHKEIHVNTFQAFLQEIEELKNKGYSISHASTDKRILFDGKNTVECQANICVTLEKGTATYTIICTI